MALRALLVDDSPTARGVIARTVQQLGCEVVGLASDGREAVDMYKRLKPDFVTMDIVMPQMGGEEALKEIRAFDPAAVVIVVSSLGMMKKVLDCVKAGASYYLVKPFSSEKLKEVLAKRFPESFPASGGGLTP